MTATLLSACIDNDVDGYGQPGSDLCPNGPETDCNDTDGEINPETYWYPDSDGDGYGNPTISLQQCVQPFNYVLDNNDCDDSDEYIYPGGPPVRVIGIGPPAYFSSLEDAYHDPATDDGNTIQSLVQVFTDDLNANRPIFVSLDGGYN